MSPRSSRASVGHTATVCSVRQVTWQTKPSILCTSETENPLYSWDYSSKT